MVVDTSALLCWVFREPGFRKIQLKLDTATSIVVPSIVLVEAGLVLAARSNGDPRQTLKRFIDRMRASVADFRSDLSWAALDAFMSFGKGRHPAKLNFGDCMIYAIAADLGLSLLFAGDDFAKTDITPA